jgi:polyamine oxidase
VAHGQYDDGREDVPGGVAGPVERLVVVGAGLAGLTVANAVTRAGIDCVVLEARSRTGGRLHTVDLGGSPVDMGGSWIHHPVGNPLRRFADQVGVPCQASNPLPSLGGFDCGLGRGLTAAEVEDNVTLQFGAFPGALDQLRAELGQDASAAEAIDAFVRASGLGSDGARRARQALRASVEADAADLPERQSLRWLWNEIEYGGDYFGDTPTAGYRSLVAALAEGLDVRLDVEVTEVSVSGDGIRVGTLGGSAVDGSHVVVAVPLGVLKGGRPQFSPPLPTGRRAAIDRLGFGRYEKVALRFDRPFWHAAGLSHLMIFPRDPDESTVWVFDLAAFGVGPVLVGHLFHRAAARAADAGEAMEWVLAMLGDAVGRPCAPADVAVTSWSTDPYCRGAYTHIPPGTSPADLDMLSEPVLGRLLFAGEHTQSARTGYADGAMTSGIREAKRLLSQRTVRLGRLGS